MAKISANVRVVLANFEKEAYTSYFIQPSVIQHMRSEGLATVPSVENMVRQCRKRNDLQLKLIADLVSTLVESAIRLKQYVDQNYALSDELKAVGCIELARDKESVADIEASIYEKAATVIKFSEKELPRSTVEKLALGNFKSTQESSVQMMPPRRGIKSLSSSSSSNNNDSVSNGDDTHKRQRTDEEASLNQRSLIQGFEECEQRFLGSLAEDIDSRSSCKTPHSPQAVILARRCHSDQNNLISDAIITGDEKRSEQSSTDDGGDIGGNGSKTSGIALASSQLKRETLRVAGIEDVQTLAAAAFSSDNDALFSLSQSASREIGIQCNTHHGIENDETSSNSQGDAMADLNAENFSKRRLHTL